MNLAVDSTAEAEYVALCEATKEALYLRKIVDEILQAEAPKQTVIFEDNTAAEAGTRNETDHNKSRHIDVCYHMIRDHVKKGNIKAEMFPTAEMIAGIMTKGTLSPDLHRRTTLRMMGHASHMSLE